MESPKRHITALFSRLTLALAMLVFAASDALAFELPRLPGLPGLPGIPQPGIHEPDCSQLPKELCKDKNIRSAVLKYVNYALTFVGLLGVISIIYAGFLYLTSFGNPERDKKAKAAILYAVTGIILILLSWVITTAVINIPAAANIQGGGGIGFYE